MGDIIQKSLFIHIPKCGGTSVEDVCLKNNIKIDALNCSTDWLNQKHKTNLYTDFHKEKDICFSFSFVRNPYSRLVSAWKTKWVGKKFRNKPFKEFIIRFCLNEKKYDWFRWSHVMPFTDPRAKIIKKGEQVVDFIGKLENINEDFGFVKNKLGISHQQLPHKNKSKHKHYTEYYDEETKSIVAEKYAKDIEYFGYEFGE
jgi:chondroitin 4-sulfotransferase 11